MTPKTTGWDELHLAENPAVELLQSLGYTYVPPEDLERERASFKETILAARLAAALKRLNPWLSETNVTKAVKAVTQVTAASLAEANETLYTSLTYGIALEQDRGDGRKSHTVRFLDFDRPDRNEWIVTRQYRVLGSKKHIIPDVVVFVNGLPLAVIECKSPTIGDAWKAEAVKQLFCAACPRRPVLLDGLDSDEIDGAMITDKSIYHAGRARRRRPGGALSATHRAGAEAAAELIARSASAPARRVYASALGQLAAWLDGRPLDDAGLAAYLGHLHQVGGAPAPATPPAPPVRTRRPGRSPARPSRASAARRPPTPPPGAVRPAASPPRSAPPCSPPAGGRAHPPRPRARRDGRAPRPGRRRDRGAARSRGAAPQRGGGSALGRRRARRRWRRRRHRRPLENENPPLLIVSDMVRFRIRTNWTNSVSRTHEHRA